MFAPTKQDDRSWVVSMPFDGRRGFPIAWADDAAPYVDAVLKGGENHKEKTIIVSGETMSHEDMLDIWVKRKSSHAPIVCEWVLIRRRTRCESNLQASYYRRAY